MKFLFLPPCRDIDEHKHNGGFLRRIERTQTIDLYHILPGSTLAHETLPTKTMKLYSKQIPQALRIRYKSYFINCLQFSKKTTGIIKKSQF
jgi:hypothetical protein